MRRIVSMVAGISVGVVVLIPVAVQGQQTPVVVSGQVTAEGGGPIPGVQVYIPQLTYGAITGENGNYQFSVPAGRVHGQTVTLSARAIGHRPQTVPIVLTTGQPIRHDFTLAAAPVQLSEVVVTGEGIVTTTEKLGNRVDQVRSEDITKSNEPNVVEALAAKAPNIQIQSQSGDPGSSVSMQIRGIKTLTGDAQPLFVVDGIPLDNSTINTENVFAGYAGQGVVAPNRISDLNPEDIESVNILKGAAAAAIYGARAAQGVVLITTKSGKPGATRYSLRSSLSFDNVSQGYALQTIYGEGNNGLAQGVHGCTAISCMGRFSWGPRLDPDSFKVALAQSGACKKATNPTACAAAEFQARFPTGIHTYDHFGELFQTGHIFDNTLSISGGDDRRTFYLSAGRMSDQGFVVGPNNSYDRNTVRV